MKYLPTFKKSEIIELFESGESVENIADSVDVPENSVVNVLESVGLYDIDDYITRMYRGFLYKHKDDPDFGENYESGFYWVKHIHNMKSRCRNEYYSIVGEYPKY